jgi:hypothetical protein
MGLLRRAMNMYRHLHLRRYGLGRSRLQGPELSEEEVQHRHEKRKLKTVDEFEFLSVLRWRHDDVIV